MIEIDKIGDTQHLPAIANDERVETGPVRFGEDWTGIFIRGDDCMGHADVLRAAYRALRVVGNRSAAIDLAKLVELLESADEFATTRR